MALLRVRVSSSSTTCTVQYTKYENIRLIQILLSVLHDDVKRRKIRLIEGNAKCRRLKKWTCKGTLRKVSEAQNHIPPPPYILYTSIQSPYF